MNHQSSPDSFLKALQKRSEVSSLKQLQHLEKVAEEFDVTSSKRFFALYFQELDRVLPTTPSTSVGSSSTATSTSTTPDDAENKFQNHSTPASVGMNFVLKHRPEPGTLKHASKIGALSAKWGGSALFEKYLNDYLAPVAYNRDPRHSNEDEKWSQVGIIDRLACLEVDFEGKHDDSEDEYYRPPKQKGGIGAKVKKVDVKGLDADNFSVVVDDKVVFGLSCADKNGDCTTSRSNANKKMRDLEHVLLFTQILSEVSFERYHLILKETDAAYKKLLEWVQRYSAFFHWRIMPDVFDDKNGSKRNRPVFLSVDFYTQFCRKIRDSIENDIHVLSVSTADPEDQNEGNGTKKENERSTMPGRNSAIDASPSSISTPNHPASALGASCASQSLTQTHIKERAAAIQCLTDVDDFISSVTMKPQLVKNMNDVDANFAKEESLGDKCDSTRTSTYFILDWANVRGV